MNILHINCNYVTSKLHKTMIDHFNDPEIKNTVFVPVSDRHNTTSNLYTDSLFVINCFNKYDRMFYHYKQKKIINKLKENIGIQNYDLIHAYTVFTDGGIAYKLKMEFDIPYVVAVRNTDVNTFFKYMPHLRKYGVKILMNAEKIFFLSNSYKERVRSYIPKDYINYFENKSQIIPNGIDDFWIENIYDKPKTILKNKLNICFAGKIDSNKNCNLTIKACDMLRKKGINVKYTIVGDLISKSTKKMINQKKYIQYIPRKCQNELISIYRKNDIFIMPSKKESFGLVYAEAMSQGLPVIYTENEGFDGQFKEGYIGYSVNPYSYKDVANAIESVIKNYSYLQKNTIKSIRKFTWDNIVQKYENIYKSIVRKS